MDLEILVKRSKGKKTVKAFLYHHNQLQYYMFQIPMDGSALVCVPGNRIRLWQSAFDVKDDSWL